MNNRPRAPCGLSSVSDSLRSPQPQSPRRALNLRSISICYYFENYCNLLLQFAKNNETYKIFKNIFEKTIDKCNYIWYNIIVARQAGMAQSVEHVIGNDEVISSILITSSKNHTAIAVWFFRENERENSI